MVSRRISYARSMAINNIRLFSNSKNEPYGNNGLWEEQWNKIEVMRKSFVAPVDTMGCGSLAVESFGTAAFRFHTLIGAMLSPQTKDQNTAQASNNLVKILHPKPFTPTNLLALSLEEVKEAIQPVTYHEVKANNILTAAQRCKDEFNDDIPNDIDDLLSFRGVGPKIAYLTFTIAHRKTLGICVDTHVHRISNRLGWVDTWKVKSNGPEKSRKQLQSFLPHDRWEPINGLLVGFGQTICEARFPKCEQCLLIDTCKFYQDKTHMR